MGDVAAMVDMLLVAVLAVPVRQTGEAAPLPGLQLLLCRCDFNRLSKHAKARTTTLYTKQLLEVSWMQQWVGFRWCSLAHRFLHVTLNVQL